MIRITELRLPLDHPPEVLAAVKELGCDMAQGYLFGRPASLA